MNNLKKTSIALFVVAVVLIVIGNSVLVYSLVNNDSEDMKKLEENLTTSLDKFKIKVDNFSEARDEYSKVVENDLFIETVEDYDKWIAGVDEYTKYIDEFDKESAYLKDVCINHHYSSQNIKNKCDAFNEAYETVINYYVSDITSFNESIDKMNEDLIKKLNKYNLKYDFVDINSDGEYIGKEHSRGVLWKRRKKVRRKK